MDTCRANGCRRPWPGRRRGRDDFRRPRESVTCSSMPGMPHRALIRRLGLLPHPEGGHYRRIHTSSSQVSVAGRRRPAMTAIQFLLPGGQRSRWHRVDADECWHWQAGGELALSVFDPASGTLAQVRLGDGAKGARPARRAGRALAVGRGAAAPRAGRLHGVAGLRVGGLRAAGPGGRGGRAPPRGGRGAFPFRTCRAAPRDGPGLSGVGPARRGEREPGRAWTGPVSVPGSRRVPRPMDESCAVAPDPPTPGAACRRRDGWDRPRRRS